MGKPQIHRWNERSHGSAVRHPPASAVRRDGGWLLFPFLQKIGAQTAQTLRERVARELKTTFASHYTAEISLAEARKPQVIAAYNRRATGHKFLINPIKTAN